MHYQGLDLKKLSIQGNIEEKIKVFENENNNKKEKRNQVRKIII